ncbi:nucleotide exchange factor GrpE [Nocardiopsis algeriensis]|uniref:nucleotide exchange factor GrpE n=1 Tax=Nocardiopsis algeriensis TaxID=1478215 RepID=UPI003B42F1F2
MTAHGGPPEPVEESAAPGSRPDGHPAPPLPPDLRLASLEAHMAALGTHLAALDERARHREAVIDRLHAENQELRAGDRRALLDPVISDLIRLYEQLSREADGLRDRGEQRLAALLGSLADDALLALERVGVEPVEAGVGDPFRADLHRPLSTVGDPDPARSGTIARVVSPGFRDTATGRVRRRVQAHFYRHVEPAQP